MKELLYGRDENIFTVVFNGFYDAEEAIEAVSIMREDILVDEINVSGLDSMKGYSIKNGIKLNWLFNNWDCITWKYDIDDNNKTEEIIKWANEVYKKLLFKFPE